MIKRHLKLLFAVSLVLAAFVTVAHQQKAAVTKVLFNARTQHIEVMHRFYLHDAEHAVREIFGKDADIISSEQTQRQFAEYVAERFALLRDGQPLPLDAVGFETEGKFFWVYQETPVPVSLEALSVKHNALRDIWPEQENLVNVEKDDEVKSLNFNGNTELLEVHLGGHHH
ncbi:DUF6702 family protein [Bowmanella denitrificans]|uniref:DUF6702 family protein n=1 Tax=Bowmanella denitrificans TaxID=366582 RepID=UPI000C9B92B7|nr:DUF6702 family protein [Bowmanella denitrificans]